MEERFITTRTQIIQAARELLGVRFLHQGRDPNTGLDCVGFLVALGRRIGYPDIKDVTDYRRVPSAEVIRQTLRHNCDEIPVDEVGDGDIYLMRLGGIKPRHVSVRVPGENPSIIHASNAGVRIEEMTNFPLSWFVAGFRVRGLVD